MEMAAGAIWREEAQGTETIFRLRESRDEEQDIALDVLGGPDGPVMVPGWCSLADVATLLRKAAPGTRFIFNSGAAESDEIAREWLEGARAAAAAVPGSPP